MVYKNMLWLGGFDKNGKKIPGYMHREIVMIELYERLGPIVSRRDGVNNLKLS